MICKMIFMRRVFEPTLTMTRSLPLVYKCFLQAVILCRLQLESIEVLGHGELQTISDCSCVGYTTNFQCTTIGSGATKWGGTAFDCLYSGNEIKLLHEKFSNTGGTSKQCNGGDIIGRSLRVEGNNYTSQLTVNVSFELNGRTVECVYEDLSTRESTLVGQTHLDLTTEPFSPPNDIHLADVKLESLQFEWSAVANCEQLVYSINTTCGSCPCNTGFTSVSCTVNVSPKTEVCSFAVTSVVCGNITGSSSDPIYATLKIPEPPVVTGIRANYDANGLTALVIEFRGSNRDMFNISKDINGDIINFTIIYSDILTNLSCNPVTTSNLNSSLPRSCFPPLLLNNSILVSITASNRLGKGKKTKTDIAGTNKYVNLSTSPTSITCRFNLEQGSYNVRSCIASYGECGNPKQWRTLVGNTTESPTIINIDLNNDVQEYCYEVTATINNLTVIMNGNHSYNGDTVQQMMRVVRATTIAAATIVLLVIISVTSTIIAFKIYQKHYLIGVHAVFELLDKPWELLKVLQVLKLQDISIKETKIGECTLEGTRPIYMLFERDLSETQTKTMQAQISKLKPSPKCHSKVTRRVGSISKIKTMNDGPNLKESCFKYSRLLPMKSGALCSLLEHIRDKLAINNSSYGKINIMGIEGTPHHKEPGFIQIQLMFTCDDELPHNWKEDFDSIKI